MTGWGPKSAIFVIFATLGAPQKFTPGPIDPDLPPVTFLDELNRMVKTACPYLFRIRVAVM